MGKIEIMRELAQLTPQELAEVRERLEQLARDKAGSSVNPVSGSARVRTPRLADRSQSRDFIKHVTDVSAHARI
jgi:hypothetical protein